MNVDSQNERQWAVEQIPSPVTPRVFSFRNSNCFLSCSCLSDHHLCNSALYFVILNGSGTPSVCRSTSTLSPPELMTVWVSLTLLFCARHHQHRHRSKRRTLKLTWYTLDCVVNAQQRNRSLIRRLQASDFAHGRLKYTCRDVVPNLAIHQV